MVEEGVALDHAVVELALFLRRAAEGPLELRVGGEDHQPPLLRQLPGGFAEGPVQPLGLLLLQQPFAVGRVRHHLTVFALPVEFPRVRHLEAHAVLHPRQLRVAAGELHAVGVDVPAPDVVLAVELTVHGLLSGGEPQPGGQAFPPLGGEAPVQARGPVLGDQRRLDGDGAGAAEGVAEGVLPPVAGEQHQGGGQGLPQGGTVVVGPVAPLVQAVAGGVQVDGGCVLDDGELDLVAVPGLRQRLAAVDIAQPLCRGLLHDGLAGGDGVKLGVQGISLHRELPVPGDIVLPGHGGHALEQGLKVRGRKGGQLQQHPGAAAQIDVQPGDVGLGALTVDPAVLGPDVFQIQPLQLVGHQGLQPEETGDGKSHNVPPVFSFSCFPQYTRKSGTGQRKRSAPAFVTEMKRIFRAGHAIINQTRVRTGGQAEKRHRPAARRGGALNAVARADTWKLQVAPDFTHPQKKVGGGGRRSMV